MPQKGCAHPARMATRDFQRLVKLVARLFYAEGVPPPDEPLPDDDELPKPKKKAPAVRQSERESA